MFQDENPVCKINRMSEHILVRRPSSCTVFFCLANFILTVYANDTLSPKECKTVTTIPEKPELKYRSYFYSHLFFKKFCIGRISTCNAHYNTPLNIQNVQFLLEDDHKMTNDQYMYYNILAQ